MDTAPNVDGLFAVFDADRLFLGYVRVEEVTWRRRRWFLGRSWHELSAHWELVLIGESGAFTYEDDYDFNVDEVKREIAERRFAYRGESYTLVPVDESDRPEVIQRYFE